MTKKQFTKIKLKSNKNRICFVIYLIGKGGNL